MEAKQCAAVHTTVVGIQVSHYNTNELADRGSDRTETPVICEVRLLFLPQESGGFEENDRTASVPL